MRNIHFHGSELTYRETADCSASLPFISTTSTCQRACALGTPLRMLHVRPYMHLQSHLYKTLIHSSNQHSKVVMHVLVLPHTLLTLRICTCAGRRCERAMSCAHSVFRLHTSMLMHTALKSTKYRASILNSSSCSCEVMLFHCVFAHLTALQARLLHTIVFENNKMDTLEISLPATTNRPCSLDLKRL